MTPRFYYCSTWRENFWFYLGWKPNAVEKNLATLFSFDSLNLGGNGRTLECQNSEGKRVIAIWIKSKGDIPTLAHECVHAAHFCLSHKGVKTTKSNDEPLAYLTEALVRAALE